MKNLTINNILAYIILIVGMVLPFACSDTEKNENDEGMGNITIKMTDSVADYQAVNVDIQSITVHYENTDTVGSNDSSDIESSDWITLSTYAGIYNLLDFQGGVDTVLATGLLPSGLITQIRLVLGDENSLYTATDTFDLKVPSGSTSGYKINVNQGIMAGDSLVLLFDFDAEKSIIAKGNGTYSLKPVLKLK